jgi:exodeoxyribonuclease VII large subunit
MTTLTVSELTNQIKNLLEPRFMHITVRGEVTNLRAQASGHLYFTLKDEQSQISAVLFRGTAATLKSLPKQGDEIIVKGQISLYAPRGSYQVLVKSVEYAGVGDLLLKFHKMKEKLEKQGLFSPEKKMPLPPFPKTIGVVTSPTGSVIQDILNVLKRRHAGVNLVLNPVRVQGKGAEVEIAMAIEQFNRFELADVLIVGRGGGSIEDLWPFNEECVAQAISASKIPIISAVGHDTDFSISDYVADVRAPTPSAAAEIAVKEKGAQLAKLSEAKAQIEYMITQQIKHHKSHLSRFATHPIMTNPNALLSTRMQKIDEIASTLQVHILKSLNDKRLHLHAFAKHLTGFQPEMRVKTARDKLSIFSRQLKESLSHTIRLKKERLRGITSHLSAIDPKNVLQKGYCIPFAENSSSVILSSKKVTHGNRLSLQFHDGTIKVEVNT